MKTTCEHCGTPFETTSKNRKFCCHGCEYVFRLIVDQGFERYYELKDSVGTPVRSSVFQPRDTTWLKDLIEEAENSHPQIAELTLDLSGISCIGCVWLIEKIYRKMPGTVRIETNAQLGQVRLRWVTGEADIPAFAHEIQQFGYRLGPPDTPRLRESGALTGRLGLSAAFAMNAMLFTLPGYLGMESDFQFAGLFRILTVLFATLSMAVGGSYFIEKSIRGLMEKVLHIDLPIALGITGAYLGSFVGWMAGYENMIYFDFVAVFIFLMLVGRWIQEVAIEKNRNRLLSHRLNPSSVWVYPEAVDNDGEREPAETNCMTLKKDDLIAVKPGEVVPVAGNLVDERASFSLEWINGESGFQDFGKGRIVPSGAINLGQNPVKLKAIEKWSDSLLARLLHPAEDTTHRNRELETVLKAYIAVVIGTALLGGFAWISLTGEVHLALQVAISLLVVSCPCALGIAFPLANEMAVSVMRRHGLFVRDGSLWSRLKGIKKIIFDKTGTLTFEVPVISNPDDLHALEKRGQIRSFQDDRIKPSSRQPLS